MSHLLANNLVVDETAAIRFPKPQASFRLCLNRFLAFRIRGINADRWLTHLLPYCRFCFSPTAIRTWLLLGILTMLVVVINREQLWQQTQLLNWLAQPKYAALLLFLFLATRLVSMNWAMQLPAESFGVRCPDIGLLLILGTPCVYCDVSESWTLPNRWHRAAIAAAGMYADLLIAVVAAWCWLLSAPELFHTCGELQVMCLCSISTLAFNANPLMRFDGYHILADCLDKVIPREKADKRTTAQIDRLVLGPSLRPASTQGSDVAHPWLGGFAILAWLYRTTVMFTIAMLAISVSQNCNISLAYGRLSAAFLLVGSVALPAGNFLLSLWHRSRLQRQRFRLSLFALALMAAAIWIPVPQRRLSQGWLQPRVEQAIYVPAPAALEECFIEDGEKVSKGQLLFQLRSPSLELELLDLQAWLHSAELEYDRQVRKRDLYGEEVDLQRYTTAIDSARQSLENVQEQIEDLSIKSPIAGTFQRSQSTLSQDLSRRFGTANVPVRQQPLVAWKEQIGRPLRLGFLLGSVRSNSELAVLPLQDHQLADVVEGRGVQIRIPARSLMVSSKVERIVQLRDGWSTDSAQLSLRPPQRDASPSYDAENTALLAGLAGSNSPPLYAAIAKLPTAATLPSGLSIQASIKVRPATLVQLARRWLLTNFTWLGD